MLSITLRDSNKVPEEMVLDHGGLHHILNDRAEKILGRKLTNMELIWAQERLWKQVNENLKEMNEKLEEIESLSKHESSDTRPTNIAELFENESIIHKSNKDILQGIGSSPKIRQRVMCAFKGHKIPPADKDVILDSASKSIITECDSCKLAIQVDGIERDGTYRYIIREL